MYGILVPFFPPPRLHELDELEVHICVGSLA